MSLLKSKPVRSKKLRDSARDQMCTLRLDGCLFSGETVVLAHLPESGRGIARKASDLAAIYACDACHSQLDGRSPLRVSELELARSIIRARTETLQIAFDEGLIKVSGRHE